MKILVTGGAGFIGSHIVDELIRNDNKVIVIDNLSSGKRENINPYASFYEEDLYDFEKIKEIFDNEKPEVVFHLAGLIDLRKSIDYPLNDAKNNILSSINVLELSRINNIKHIIFSSSGGAVYGEPNNIPINEEHTTKPLSPYGCAKLAIEKYFYFYKKNYNLKYTILRLSNIYGPRQNNNGESGVISIFLNKMLKNNKPEIFGGTQTRDFLYVKDAVKAFILALKDKESNIYNVGSSKESDIIEIFSKINKYFKNKFEPIYLPEKKGEIKRSCLSYEKIKNNLGWKPSIEIEEGLDRTYCYFLKNLNKIAIKN